MVKKFVHLEYHLVFSTFRRRKIITEKIEPQLYRYIGSIVRNKGGRLCAIGGIEDHLHLDLGIPASMSVSDMVSAIKANSSRWMRAPERIGPDFKWQVGYSCFTVSAHNQDKLRQYIAHQKEHHKKFGLKEELEKLLKLHAISFREEDIA